VEGRRGGSIAFRSSEKLFKINSPGILNKCIIVGMHLLSRADEASSHINSIIKEILAGRIGRAERPLQPATSPTKAQSIEEEAWETKTYFHRQSFPPNARQGRVHVCAAAS
jgi:hypothetical protein